MQTVRLRTPFEVTDTPLSEYPRPQFARDSYMTLNGKWDYAILRKSENFTGAYQGKILVPFSPESLLSGCPEGTLVTPNDALYYHRTFDVPHEFLKAHTILHFDAVDFECEITLNGRVVGEHRGGYMPFSIDVSDYIRIGENDIRLVVTDPTDTSYHTHAKQAMKRGGIWYTPQSGIWQSVWLESMPYVYLKDVTIVPDIDNDVIKLTFEKSANAPVEIIVLDDGEVKATATCEDNYIEIPMGEYELWCPENPKLYDLAFKIGDDTVKSYFGMRKFSWVTDSKGYKRMGLNNKPYFHTGVLDQGYWSDGMLTPPSNAALEYDVKLVKSMGFNMIRKHIKIEPLRWYYHCDKEGILVWQDMVTGGTKYKMMYIGVLAFLEIHIKDNNEKAYKRLARQDKEGRDEFENEVRITMDYLKNCVSLSTWVAFNEGWGQFDSVRITNDMKQIDPTRLIDSVSGWNDQGKGTSDTKSRHIYFKPIRMPRDKRCLLLSEFGGYSIKTEGHVFSPHKSFGYRIYKTPEKIANAYKKLFEKSIIPNIDKGLSATVYTQVSDVEEEINGLVTYDRKVIKLPVDLVKSLNQQLVIKD
ncbi:MAG: beta-galactosidase [Bacteroides sp.]|nr:glycoside hydrolase family 2 [Bacillota bacterium]MCM1394082.1 glycoside hydrolase family 2 [[Eubacterium] siraeum]MCM1455158.1 beta-galactosidase [Bacteroides sp.]